MPLKFWARQGPYLAHPHPSLPEIVGLEKRDSGNQKALVLTSTQTFTSFKIWASRALPSQLPLSYNIDNYICSVFFAGQLTVTI